MKLSVLHIDVDQELISSVKIFPIQGSKIQRFRRGSEPQTVMMTEEPITAIRAVQGRVFYATGKKIFSFSPRSGRATLIREADVPVSGLSPSAIRK